MVKRSEVDEFLKTHERVVVSTLDDNGRSQMSLVIATFMDGQIMFTTPAATRKARNAMRDSRVTALVLGDNFWEYLVVEGRASFTRLPEAAELLRTVYERIAHKAHPDWNEYDEAMRHEDRVVFKITPGRMYPLTD
jgi:PPOX class probable F420-dependent enzyme